MNAASADQRRIIFINAILAFRPGIDNRAVTSPIFHAFFTIAIFVFIMWNGRLRRIKKQFHVEINDST
jgi:hypothetical protein